MGKIIKKILNLKEPEGVATPGKLGVHILLHPTIEYDTLCIRLSHRLIRMQCSRIMRESSNAEIIFETSVQLASPQKKWMSKAKQTKGVCDGDRDRGDKDAVTSGCRVTAGSTASSITPFLFWNNCRIIHVSNYDFVTKFLCCSGPRYGIYPSTKMDGIDTTQRINFVFITAKEESPNNRGCVLIPFGNRSALNKFMGVNYSSLTFSKK